MSYDIIFLFIDLKGSAVLSSSPPPAPACPVCSRTALGGKGTPEGTLARQTPAPGQAHAAAARLAGCWPFSLVWTSGLCLLLNLKSRFLTSGLLQIWWCYSLSRSAVMIRLWLYVISPCLSLLPILLPGFVETFPDLLTWLCSHKTDQPEFLTLLIT